EGEVVVKEDEEIAGSARLHRGPAGADVTAL
ncbi:MAG: hypothetical protein ACI9OJ_003464, partial [Myxococcota bacterium]